MSQPYQSSFTIVNSFPAPLTFKSVDSLGTDNEWDTDSEPPQQIAAGATSRTMVVRATGTDPAHPKGTSATITYNVRVNGVTSAVSFSVSCPVAEVNTTAVDFIPSTTGFRSKTEPSIFSAKPLSVKFTVST